MAKCINFTYKNSIKSKFSRGSAPDPAGGAYSTPQLDFVPTTESSWPDWLFFGGYGPGKLLEHIIYSSIFCHLNEFNILCEEQHGFQTGKSCETQLIMTINDFVNCLNENSQIDCILLEAFDRVPHTRLCKKLSYYGIRGPLLLWIKHYLSNRYQRVIIDGTSSDPSVVTSGVPQGTVLAPLLFLCFVNDIPLNVTSKIKLYDADDILLYRTISSQADCTLLQKDIDSLIQWSNIWQLPFNFKKCEFLRITNKFSPIITTYQMGAKTINQVISAKYLGITINEKCSGQSTSPILLKRLVHHWVSYTEI